MGSMMRPFNVSSAAVMIISRILDARRPNTLPPEHRSWGDGRASIQAGLRARMTLHTQPPIPPPATHFVTTRTAFPMSVLSASSVSNRLVPALEGQMESHSAQPSGMSWPFLEERAKRSHLV